MRLEEHERGSVFDPHPGRYPAPPAPFDGPTGDYLCELTARLRTVLGDRLHAAYATGSLALGGYDSGRSDLDVLVVAAGALTVRERDQVVARCRHEALPCPARKLELVVYPAAEARVPSDAPRWSLNLNSGAGQPLHAGGDALAEPGHWFVVDLALTRAHGIALTGPPPAVLIGPVAPERMMRAQAAAVAWWAANEPGEATIAAAARAWRYAERGDFVTKDQAVRWAMSRIARTPATTGSDESTRR